jgi:hypothetical protein
MSNALSYLLMNSCLGHHWSSAQWTGQQRIGTCNGGQLTDIKVHHSNKWQTFVTMVMNFDVPRLIDSIAQNVYLVLHSSFGNQNIQCFLWTAQPITVHHCTLPSARQYTIHRSISSRPNLMSTVNTTHVAVCICHLTYSLYATCTSYPILHLSPQWGFVEYKLSTAMLCNFFQRSVTSCLLDIKILFNPPF